MKKIKIKVFAKLNYALDIVGKQDNGYHLLDMIATSIDIFDIVQCEKSTQNQIFMNGIVCSDKSNTAYRATSLLNQKFGICMSVKIDKQIPYCAGLGGSSADASAVFWCASKLFDIDITKMSDIALKVGCDVIYMMKGGNARIGGVGERVSSINIEKQNLLIFQYCMGASTQQVYQNYDFENKISVGKVSELLQNFDTKNLYNVLQESAIALCPNISKAYELLSQHTQQVYMTGSGSAFFGVFDNFDKAKEVEMLLKDKGIYCKATKSLNNGIKVISYE